MRVKKPVIKFSNNNIVKKVNYLDDLKLLFSYWSTTAEINIVRKFLKRE